MRKLTPYEILSLSKILEMETKGLTVAKASLGTITDEQLKSLAQSGINATEIRIAGLQQFINENDVIETGEVQ